MNKTLNFVMRITFGLLFIYIFSAIIKGIVWIISYLFCNDNQAKGLFLLTFLVFLLFFINYIKKKKNQ